MDEKNCKGTIMVKRIIIILILGVLTACSSFSDVKTVEIPVAVCAKPPVINRPYLPIYALEDAKNDELIYAITAKSYVITIKQLQEYSKQLELILDTYRNSCPDSPEVKNISIKELEEIEKEDSSYIKELYEKFKN